VRIVLGPILPCLYDERDFISYGEILRYIAVKDENCFVYGEKNSPNPIYNIPIEHLSGVKEDPNNPNKKSLTVSPMPNTNLQAQTLETVLLLDSTGNLVFQLSFDTSLDKDIANRFLASVANANMIGKSNDLKSKTAAKVI